jgi:hypothetical protein
LRRYEDWLAVTDVEPLVAYVASGFASLDEEAERRLRTWVEDEIRQYGAVRIDKESGVFIAR